MSELSPNAQALIRSGRAALQPTDADRERVLAALRARLRNLDQPPSPEPSLAPAAARSPWPLVSATIAGVAVLGTVIGVAWFGREAPSAAPSASTPPAPSGAEASTAAPPAPEAPPASSAPAPGDAPSPAPEATAAPRSSAAPSLPSSRRAPDRLAEEVAILARAASDLRRGRPADALRSLNEHQTRFPKGALAEERRAAKAEALCSLGRFAEAQAELAAVSRNSPHGARARAACRSRSPSFQ